MSLFIDKHNRRKSPLALAAFGAALLDLCIFGLLYALLAEPLYNYVQLGGSMVTTAVHSAVIAAVGTAACCLLFLLEDKRIAPLGFAGLAVVLGMFYAAALMLDRAERGLMFQLITMYGLAPVLIGNAAAWSAYLKIRRVNPAPGHKKTVRQELLEAVSEEAVRQERKKAGQTEKTEATPQPAAAPAEPVEPEAKRKAASAPEEALFGPESGGGPSSFRSEEEEAMLLYMDDDDEESDD